ncbi:MAG: ComF family protein [Acutalibacteraceae bacterium]|nr:ComF family protein [Acutalibacteraceae bacterium]
MSFKNLYSLLINAFFPARCPYCNEVIFKNNEACDNCKSELEYENIITVLYKSRNISPFKYSGINKKAVLNFKFNNNPNYSEQLAISMQKAIANEYSIYLGSENQKYFDIITYVPFTKKRYRKRGYNQSQLLAKNLSDNLNIDFQPILLKTKDNQAQHTLPKAERKRNVEGVFEINPQYKVFGKTILLIDDILTTGSTLNECINVLYANGAEAVLCATYATAIAKD